MNATKMPAFTAEASLYRSGTHYQVGAILAGLHQGGEGLVYPALRVFCGNFTCCFEFSSASPPVCCGDDGQCFYLEKPN
jgi:hypothetical protein